MNGLLMNRSSKAESVSVSILSWYSMVSIHTPLSTTHRQLTKLFVLAQASKLLTSITATKGSFTFPSRNLIDIVWGKARPTPITSLIKVHPLEFAGKPGKEKLSDLASWLATGGDKATNNGGFPNGSSYLINELDQIAWLLNLRGASFPCSREWSCRETSVTAYSNARVK